MTIPKRDGWPAAPVIYEIYPRSFRDSTGTGVGDLPGITEKLDHVADLGIDAIWIAPFYVSPQHDYGYDVADHFAVDPRFGTLEDFDALVARAHKLGLKVMIDQVLNHTSTEHPWFQAALKGDDPCAQRYLWRDPKPDGSPPNNWRSFFGPSAWTWAHEREQYYFHQFLTCQPSLNLRDPEVQELHRSEIAFWNDRGVDGYRFDAVTSYLYDESLMDNPPAAPDVRAKVLGARFNLYTYQDHIYDILPGDGAAYTEKLRDWAGKSRWLLGEIGTGNQSIEMVMAMTGKDRLDAGYTTDMPESGATPATVADILGRAERPTTLWWLSSHDQPRHATALGDGTVRDARFFAMLCAVLPGPWMIYQGEELGLPQPGLSRESARDPFDLLYWPDGPGRDGPRVPMPWDDGQPNFGFGDGDPWLPMDWPDGVAVAQQGKDGVMAFYRSLTALRRDLALGEGTAGVTAVSDSLLEVKRETPKGTFRCIFNYGEVTMDIGQGSARFASMGDGAPLEPRTGAIWEF